MQKTYDKAKWHIEAGEAEKKVIARFKVVFDFLNEKKLLNEDGIETFEYCLDKSVSLNSSMVTKEGKKFLDKYYDEILESDVKEMRKKLDWAYKDYIK